MNFEKAFSLARARGEEKFYWNYQLFHTRKYGETVAQWRANLLKVKDVPIFSLTNHKK